MTAAGSETALATTSRTSLCDGSASRAARQSAMNWLRSNEVTMGSSQSIDSYVTLPHRRRGVRISIQLNAASLGAGERRRFVVTIPRAAVGFATAGVPPPPDNVGRQVRHGQRVPTADDRAFALY